MYTKKEYLQYIASMKDAEEKQVKDLQTVLSAIQDPQVTQVLRDILEQEIRRNLLVDALKKAVEETV